MMQVKFTIPSKPQDLEEEKEGQVYVTGALSDEAESQSVSTAIEGTETQLAIRVRRIVPLIPALTC